MRISVPSWFAIPRKRLSSLVLVGAGIRRSAAVFWGSAEIPWLLTVCPKNCTLGLQKEHLAVFSVTPRFSNLSRTAFNHESAPPCSSHVLERRR